jgi:hypothetical protein
MAIAFVAAQSLLLFYYANVEETKALIPISLLAEYVDHVTGDMEIAFVLSEYGGL